MNFIDGKKLAQVALSCVGTPTSAIPGTDGGRIACAYATRLMIQKAGFWALSGMVTSHPLDNLDTNYGYANSFYGNDVGRIFYPMGGLIEGDILFWHTMDSYPSHVVTHVGIYVGNSMAVSNSSSQRQIRSHAIDYMPIVGACRAYAPETNPSANVTQATNNASALNGIFKNVYTGNYAQGLGVNTGVTSSYPEDMSNSSQNKLNEEKHSSTFQLDAIGDFRVRAKMEAIVRGVGKTFGGKYYIKSVRHTIERNSPYKVSVELTRNAVGDNTSQGDLQNISPSTNTGNTGNNSNNTNNTSGNLNQNTNYNNTVITSGGVYSGTSTTLGQDKWGTTINP